MVYFITDCSEVNELGLRRGWGAQGQVRGSRMEAAAAVQVTRVREMAVRVGVWRTGDGLVARGWLEAQEREQNAEWGGDMRRLQTGGNIEVSWRCGCLHHFTRWRCEGGWKGGPGRVTLYGKQPF